MDKLNGQSMNLEEKNIEEIKKLFPNVVIEGKIDFEKLKLMLGEEIDDSIEKYQFTWNGKSKAIKLAQLPSKETLRPSKEDSKNWDTTDNLYIEGDNLEVLKQLQKTYFGKIKMIYIDPPYNTGNDFVYKDNFTDSVANYRIKTNQQKKSNADTSGRYHTEWMNLIYPRLMLAKNLLTDDGAIFVSIDDTEQSNLEKLMNEIFGENNHIKTLIVNTSEGGGQAKHVINGHEFVLVYAKDISSFKDLMKPKDIRGKTIEKEGVKYWIQEDSIRKVHGKYGNLHYEEILEFKNEEFKEKIDKGILNGEYMLLKKENNKHIIGKLRRLDEDYSKFHSILKHLTKFGKKDFQKYFKESDSENEVFPNPKPMSLIKELVLSLTLHESDCIILDFFSGSGTTANAVMELNLEDNGNRKYILVQLPEKIHESEKAFKAGYKNICEIGKERIRRAGEQIKQELIEKKEKAGMLDENIVDPESLDIGFKVFK